MTDSIPVIVALPLDQQTDDILTAALELGRRLERPLVMVHALERRRLEGDQAQAARVTEAKEVIDRRLGPLRAAGLEVRFDDAANAVRSDPSREYAVVHMEPPPHGNAVSVCGEQRRGGDGQATDAASPQRMAVRLHELPG